MTNWANNFGGGANGVAITAANSGGASGDPFSTVNQGNGVTFDNTHLAVGLMSCKIAAGSAISACVWQPASAFSNGTVRVLVYAPTLPASSYTIAGFYSGSTARVRLSISTTGKLVLNSAAGGTATSTSTVPTTGFFWIEFSGVFAGGTGGSSTVNYYSSLTATTPTETIGQTGVNYGGTADRIRLGVGTLPPISSPDFWIAGAAANDTGAAIGPVSLTGTVGEPVETDIAQPLTASKTKQLGQPAEIDIAQPLTASKTKQLGQPAEIDIAQPLTASKTKQLGQPAETSTAQPLTASKTKQLGHPAETDTALPVTGAKARTLGQAGELDQALPIGSSSAVGGTLGQAAEADTAHPARAAKTAGVGRPTTTDTAWPLTAAKVLILGLAGELDAALPVVGTRPGRNILVTVTLAPQDRYAARLAPRLTAALEAPRIAAALARQTDHYRVIIQPRRYAAHLGAQP